ASRAQYGFIGEVPLFVRALDPRPWLDSHRVAAPLRWLSRAALPALALLDASLLRRARKERLALEETAAFDDRADALWATLRGRYPVLARRDLAWLQWRFERYPQRGRYR